MIRLFFAALTIVLTMRFQEIPPTRTPIPPPEVDLSQAVIDHIRTIHDIGIDLGVREDVFQKSGTASR